MRTNENGVSVPTNTNLFGVKIDRKQFAMLSHHVMGQGGFSIAEPSIGLLERNYIRTNLVYDGKDPFWPTQTVSADGLADVIAGNPDHEAKLAASSAAAKPKC